MSGHRNNDSGRDGEGKEEPMAAAGKLSPNEVCSLETGVRSLWVRECVTGAGT